MNYVDDKLHGEMTTFYNDGQIESKITLIKGKRSGPYKYLDSNGINEEAGIFLEDKLHGLITRWYGEEQISSITMIAYGNLQ